MTDDQTQQDTPDVQVEEHDLDVSERIIEGNYTELEASYSVGDKAGQRMVNVTARLRRNLGADGVDAIDVVAPFAEAHQIVKEAADRKFAEVFSEAQAAMKDKLATAAPAYAPQAAAAGAPAGAMPQAPAGGDGWATGNKPQGKGQVRYITSDFLPSDTFKAMVYAKIEEAGMDAQQFVVYDNRVGKFGFESGNENWSVAAVKGAEGSVWAQQLGKKSAFFVDFVYPSGDITVKLSRDGEAVKTAIALAGQINAPAAATSAMGNPGYDGF